MKKITFYLFMLLSFSSIKAQLYQVPLCNGTIASNTYGPMNSVATANATNRTAVIYPSAQLAPIAGQTLTSLYFNRLTATGSMSGAPNFRIYLKETSQTDFGATAIDWATETATATLVYNSDPTSVVGSNAGWKNFVLSNNFLYSGTQNLAVYMEYINTAASTTIGWEYEYSAPCITTSNSNTTKYINNTTGTPGASLTSTNYRRPQIGFDYLVSCPAPTSFAASNVATTTVDLNWVAGGSESEWEYAVLLATDPAPTSGTTVMTNSVVGYSVQPATNYKAYLRANCGTNDNSVWTSITFTTPCASYTPSYTQDFATFPPNCWTRAAAGDPTTGPTGTAAGIWAADGFLNSGTTGAIKVNLYSLNRIGWMISPTIDMTAGNYRVKFDYAVTTWNNTTPSAMGSDDVVQLVISEDGGTTWQVLTTLNAASNVLNSNNTFSLELPAYTNANTKFAFYATDGTIDDAEDYDFFIDNFVVETIPSCVETSTPVATNLTSTSVDLSWNAGGSESEWEYVLALASDPTPTSGTSTMVTSLTGVSLSPSTNYIFYVRAVCGTNNYSVWKTLNVNSPATPPANDDCSGAIALTVNTDLNCGTITGGTVLGATASSVDATTCAGTEDDDVWFSFVATSTSHRIALSNIVGSVTDMYHSLWTGVDCDNLTLVPGSCSDPNTSNPSGLVIGETYYVRVYTYTATGSQNTTFDICVGTPPAPPANDDCSGAIALTVNSDFACGTVTSGTVQSATASAIDATACFGTEDDDVWYSFVASNTSHRITLSNIVGSVTDMYHSLWTGTDCNSLALVPGSCSDPNTSNPSGLTIGQTYYIRVYTYTATGGQNTTFDICVGTPPPPPANDNFANAIAISCGNIYSGDTTLATLDEDNAPDGFGADMDAPNVWYSFTGSGTSQSVTLDLCNSSYDTSVLVYTGTSGNLTLIAANDDDNTCTLTTRSKVTFTSDGTTTYYIAVEGWNVGSIGAFNMDVTCTDVNPPAVNNQDCGTSLAVNVDGIIVNSDNSFGTVNSAQPTCDTFGSIQDVWFSFVAPTSGLVDCEVSLGTITSANFTVYEGACGSLTEVAGTCNSNFTTTTTENLTGLTAGNTYYVQVWSNSSEQGTFGLRLSDPSLSNTGFDNSTFTYYPNPVKNILNLSYSQNISHVEVFNLLGQKMTSNDFNANTAQVDMSNLASGAYLVKVTSDNTTKTVRVIKE
ncbi:T9SS type A sorting domain-containing protein [Flavobacterium capsici]|uniref:T9SS type A sorting domain-containing protein n=1 Tax=Flavobacterium capsici TaxID=3075618 RepID=A0AA96EU71_9FLAO|nr:MULTISPECIES: T9SS type A sorting domain-containing protein [unclassified Flavobacterium]WNM18306.1 T9SS type A sorting domain-containing protein [Flavobacterium sp. PMR2A8]WNM22357.1 T9SS type A sorting domain-containing protein [Flavobacterium sp. PMTSA4]